MEKSARFRGRGRVQSRHSNRRWHIGFSVPQERSFLNPDSLDREQPQMTERLTSRSAFSITSDFNLRVWSLNH